MVGAAYQWYLDGEILDGMTEAYLIAEGDGNYQVEVFNANGCSRISEETIYTGIEDIPIPAFQLYPNPAEDYLELSGLEEWSVTSLSDSYGRSLTIDGRWIGSDRLDIHDLAKGIYFLQIQSGMHLRTLRVIKE